MSDTTEDPDLAAERLEMALERIAILARAHPVARVDANAADPALRQVADGLDAMIARLRAGLSGRED